MLTYCFISCIQAGAARVAVAAARTNDAAARAAAHTARVVAAAAAARTTGAARRGRNNFGNRNRHLNRQYWYNDDNEDLF